MQVAINARFISNRLEGIGRYNKEIVHRMALNHPEVTFHLLLDRPFTNESYCFKYDGSLLGACRLTRVACSNYHYEVRVKRWLLTSSGSLLGTR